MRAENRCCKPLSDLTREHAFGSGEARVPDHNAIRLVFSPGCSRDQAGARPKNTFYTSQAALYQKLSNRAIYGSSFGVASVARGLFPRFNKYPDAVIKQRHDVRPNETPLFLYGTPFSVSFPFLQRFLHRRFNDFHLCQREKIQLVARTDFI